MNWNIDAFEEAMGITPKRIYTYPDRDYEEVYYGRVVGDLTIYAQDAHPSPPRPSLTAYSGYDGPMMDQTYWHDGNNWVNCLSGNVWSGE